MSDSPSTNTDPLLAKALEAVGETPDVDFKSSLDVDNKGQWLEVLKDLAAMANSGGGVILFGLDDSGNPTGSNVSPILNYDTARIGDKLCKYTKVHFGGFTLFPVQRGRIQIAGIRVSASTVPLVFTADGQYLNEYGQERFAFRQGTVYFRHGSKSEPGTSDDLRAFVEREVERVKASWLHGIRQVVEAPPGAVVSVGLPIQAATLARVRLVADANAPGVVLIDPNTTHPHRLREVVSEVNQRLGDGTHMALCDKREVSVDSISKLTRGVFEVSDLTGHKPPLLRKGRIKGGRTYEVLTPLERLDGLQQTLRGASSTSEQLALLDATDNTPVVFGPKLVDVLHLLSGNAEQGERLDHLAERFRGQREQIRAALQYLKQRDPDRWVKACDKLLPFYDDLFAQTAAVAKEWK
jgi:hypothetical protein